MKLSFPAWFPRGPRGNSQPKPQNSRSIQLKVVPPKSAPVPGLPDAAGCALLSVLLFLGCGGSFLRLFALPAAGALMAAVGLAAIAAFHFVLPLPQITKKMKYAAAGGLGAGSVLLWAFTAERSRNGLVIAVNQIQQLFAAEFSRIEPRYIVTVEPEEFLVCTTLFLIPFALLLSLFCCVMVRRALWQPAALLLVLAAVLGPLEVIDTGGVWTLLLCLASMLLVCRALSARGGAPDRGVILLPAAGVMAFALLAGSLLLVSLGSPQEKLDGFFSRGGGAVRSVIHSLRYEGEMLPGLPEGDLSRPGDRLSMKDALEITFEAPYPMHLRGYVGQRFTGSGWEALDRNAVAGYNSLFYRLHQNGFYPQTQLGSLAEALGYYDEGRANRMTVKNISACRSAVYAPYGLADVKTGGLLDADRTTEALLRSPGWSGQAEYEFSILPEDFSKADAVVSLFDQQKDAPSAALSKYLTEEARYRHFVYENYTGLPDIEREQLAPDLGEAGVPGQTHRGYTDAKSTIFSVLNSKLGFSTRAKGFDGEGSLIQTLYERQSANAAQYASAAVLMLRYCGIPARYVEGYLVTSVDLEGVEPGDVVYVPSGNASAWAEYYHDGVGWLPFDVIPGYQQAVSSGIPPEASAGGGQDEPPPPDEEDPPADPPAEQANPLAAVLFWLLPLWVLLLALFLWLARRYWLISRRERSFAVEDPNQAVCNMTAFLLKLLPAVGLPDPAGSIRKLTAPAGEKWGAQWGDSLGRMTELFEKAAFSPHWLTGEERAEAETLVDDLLDQIDRTESKKNRFVLRWVKCLY